MLVHRCNARFNGVARVLKLHWLTIEKYVTCGWLVNAGHSFDECGLSCSIVTQQTVAFAG